jgi:hypothetical protein
MTAQRIHLLPEVQDPPTLTDKRLAKVEDDMRALRDGLLTVVIVLVVLMALVAVVIVGVL